MKKKRKANLITTVTRIAFESDFTKANLYPKKERIGFCLYIGNVPAYHEGELVYFRGIWRLFCLCENIASNKKQLFVSRFSMLPIPFCSSVNNESILSDLGRILRVFKNCKKYDERTKITARIVRVAIRHSSQKRYECKFLGCYF